MNLNKDLDLDDKTECLIFYEQVNKINIYGSFGCYANPNISNCINNIEFIKSQLDESETHSYRNFLNYNSETIGNLAYIVAYCPNKECKKIAYQHLLKYEYWYNNKDRYCTIL